MNKAGIQGLITVGLFFSVWLALSRIDWMTLFKVEHISNKTEEKLGEIFWESFSRAEQEIKNPEVTAILDSILTKICTANEIDKSHIKLHLLQKDEINAFALPDGHLVIFSGLIAASDNAGELTGVMCHELAHIQLNHVMKSLVKEVGLTVLISMTAGNAGGDVIRETGRLLSSAAYDRGIEKEADIKAVDYLVKANIDPEPLANFLYKLGSGEANSPEYLSWLSTHPDSKERAAYIVEYSSSKKKDFKPVLGQAAWEKLRESVSAD